MRKRIIGTIAVSTAGLASVTGLWISAQNPAANRPPVTPSRTSRGSIPIVAVAGVPLHISATAVAVTASRRPVPSRSPAKAAPAPARVHVPAVTRRKPPVRRIPRRGYGPIRTAAGVVTAAAQKDGVKITYRRWAVLAGQQWHAFADGTIRDAAGYCLNNGSNGGTVLPRIWRCNGSAAERWQVIPNAGMISAKGVGKTLRWSVADADYNSSPGTGTIGLDGMNITRNGKVFVPYGISSSVFQYPSSPYLDGPGNPTEPSPLQEAEDQVAASARAWHSNTFRFQVEQNLCLATTGCVADVVSAVRYAESLGQVVVLNPSTEPSEPGTKQDDTPFPDTSTTAFWQAFAPYFKSDRDVILDVFNEPDHGVTCCDWVTWKSSFQSEINAIRAMGYTSQLWVEPPGAEGFDNGYLRAHWNSEHLTDPRGDLVYDYHHTTTRGGPPGSSTPSIANWTRQFGDLVADQKAPVTDGEWTNRSAVGRALECWNTAPTAVPAYLNYLDAEGIGLSAWAQGDFSNGGSILTAPSGGFASANSYPATGYTCSTSMSGVYGAGADLQAWWAKRTKPS